MRQEEVLTYDISRERPDGPYTLHVIQPDGSERLTQIANASDLIDHVAALTKRLLLDGWSLDHRNSR